MSDQPEQIIRDLETELIRPDVRSTPGRVAELLADGFIEFGESGKRYNKQDVLAHLVKPSEVKYTILDLATVRISSDTILALYRAQKEIPKSGKRTFSLRSSVWQNRNGAWQMIFHQGTPQSAPSDANGES